MNQRRIEGRKRRIALIEQHSDLRAPKNKAISASHGESLRDIDKVLPPRFGHPPEAQLIIDDLMDKRSIGFIRDNYVSTGFLPQPPCLTLLFHCTPRPHDCPL